MNRAEDIVSRKGADTEGAEVQRILALPLRYSATPDECEAISQEIVQVKHFEKGFRLTGCQVESVLAAREAPPGTGVFVSSGVGSGKCVVGYTEVYDAASGRRRRVDELGSLTVSAIDERTGKIGLHQATAFASGFKLCSKVKLAGGQQVELSLDHPIFTPGGWVKAGDLKTGDFVGTPRKILAPLRELVVSDDEVKLVAYLMADGATSGSGATFTNETPCIIEEFFQVAKACGTLRNGHLPGASKAKNQNAGKATTYNVRGVRPIVNACLSKHKRLPAEFYGLSDRQIGIFLNRFWSCDGHVGKTFFEVCLASQGLIDDIRFLLLRLGIVARKHYKAAKCEGKTFDSWRLAISGREPVLRFLEKVGFIFGKETASVVLLNRTRRIKGNTNVDVVPISRKEVSEICDELGLRGIPKSKLAGGAPRTELRERLGATTGQFVGRSSFQSWVFESGYTGKYAWLATSDIFWERVESVSEPGPRRVFDLSVPSVGNFVANGVCIHNTGCALLIAAHAYRNGKKKILLLVPNAVLDQLYFRDLEWARQRFGLPFGVIRVGFTPTRQAALAGYTSGLFLLPYSQLSTRQTDDVLARIKPDLVIADEVHHLKNKGSARTKRILRYIDDSGCDFVGLSGTITSKSLGDYAHLMKRVLRNSSPLPLPAGLVTEWGQVLDAGSQPSEKLMRPLLPLLEWARKQDPREPYDITVTGFRKAYRFRRTHTVGVVAAGDQDIGTSLVIANDAGAGEPDEATKLLMDDVSKNWTTPGGDEIDHAIHKFKWLYELSAGFYNELSWPVPAALAIKKGISEDAATDLVLRSKRWHARHQDYVKASREWLGDFPRVGMDTPFLLASEIAKHGSKNVGERLYGFWRAAKDIDFPERLERDSRAVRLCDYKIKAAVAWAKQHQHGILWVYHQEIGEWLHEALVAAGIPAIHAPAGELHDRALLACTGKELVVASMPAHGFGKNLQLFSNAYFVQWPRAASMAEQTLGRLHRLGQAADELTMWTNRATEFDAQCFFATLVDAIYVHQTVGRQKLVYAGYSPLPKRYPSEFLRERGFENAKLAPEQEQALAERFS